MKCPSYDLFFETFSNKTRMRIIEALTSGKKSVNELCRITGEEQSKVSHNLKKLTECRFLDFKREGKKRIYSLNQDTIIPILKLVEKHVRTYCREACSKK
ncbi:metalloregulator ArsR/SmtB family transcription factor [Candidatus Woesearchaeota archaeon]|nr:metalloregulator ArsR/SmtB family transcription factor [Candidatus Woesearchaeota archaeon]